MVATSWDRCYQMVRQEEGGNDDDPDDPGGRTSRGITQREYNAWCHLHGKPAGDVWKASEDDVKAIYHQQYWMPYGDQLPAGADCIFFDTAVVQGPGAAATLLQQALGVHVDGRIGVITLAAANSQNAQEIITKFTAARVNRFRHTRQAWKYLKGWLNRAYGCQKIALSLLST